MQSRLLPQPPDEVAVLEQDLGPCCQNFSSVRPTGPSTTPLGWQEGSEVCQKTRVTGFKQSCRLDFADRTSGNDLHRGSAELVFQGNERPLPPAVGCNSARALVQRVNCDYRSDTIDGMAVLCQVPTSAALGLGEGRIAGLSRRRGYSKNRYRKQQKSYH